MKWSNGYSLFFFLKFFHSLAFMSARQTEAIKRLVESDLDKLVPIDHSWHSQYSSSAYIYIGNLDPRLTEGDIVTVFSQFGDIVDINVARDKESGKSLGYCFLAFEDQRSTVLAIDNMVGYPLVRRPLRIDHVLDYKYPIRYHPTDVDDQGFKQRIAYEPTGAEGKGIGVYNVTESQRKLSAMQQGQARMMHATKIEDEDEAWARSFAESIKKEIKSEYETPVESPPR
jgi:RNA-binding motif X-linked protein 2